MGKTLLSVKDLSINFGSGRTEIRAVKGLSYELFRGETLAIVGESGSGKSVSSLALLDLLPKAGSKLLSGTAVFEGYDLLALSEAEITAIRGNRIAMIFQEPMTSLNPVLTIGRQLTEGLIEHQGMDFADAKIRALEMMQLVKLPNPEICFQQFPHQLSGGMRQRAMIAMAMASNPAILIADEPTTALDVTIQAQILDLMRELKKNFETSIILITHDMGVVAEMADRVIVMRDGEKIEEGTVRQIFETPKADYTIQLLNSVPRLGNRASLKFPKHIVSKPVLPGKDPLLLVEDVNKRFTTRGLLKQKSETIAMDDIGFSVASAETLALVGESGSGKSTTGRAILRLIEVDSGNIYLEGQNIRALRRAELRRKRGKMQMIFQDPFASLNPRMSVGRLVMEPMIIHRIFHSSELRDRAASLLKRVGMQPDHLARYPHEFSGGQRQRIAIARALATNPKLIVADEPTSALDVSVQAQVIELLLELQQSLGIAYVFISHDMAVVEEMAHKVAVMHKGRIVEIGPRMNVLNDPQHNYTRLLLQAVPVPDPARKRNILPKIEFGNVLPSPLSQVSSDHWVAK